MDNTELAKEELRAIKIADPDRLPDAIEAAAKFWHVDMKQAVRMYKEIQAKKAQKQTVEV